MDLRKLKKLIDLVEESSITELEINDAEEKVRIVKNGGAMAHQAYALSMATPAQMMAAAPATVTVTPTDEPTLPEGDVVKAPMVGTFYRAASPGAEAFVQLGSVVKAGETLCIIEAMKLFNEIESEVSGKIVKVMVEDATPVEYDQVLFLVEP